MDRISNKINSDSSYINYEHFAKTYLLSAKILLEAKESSVERNATEKMRIDSGLIYIPIIYLIRHSIELILKSVDVGNSKSYLKTHDLENLHKELDNLGIEINTPLKEYLVKIIDKYMSYKFGVDLLNVIDFKNDVFRFPDNSTKVKIKGENLSKLDSKEMLREVTSLNSLCVQLSAIWQIQRQLRS